eukprot:6247306-Pyramimonas_sp.AAC.1
MRFSPSRRARSFQSARPFQDGWRRLFRPGPSHRFRAYSSQDPAAVKGDMPDLKLKGWSTGRFQNGIPAFAPRTFVVHTCSSRARMEGDAVSKVYSR